MKKLLICSITLLYTLCNSISYAGNEPQSWVEKKKVIVQSFEINRNDKVSVQNTFGDVKVNNWTNNEVKIEVTVIVFSNDEVLATALLNEVWLDINHNGDVSFITKIGANGSNTNIVKNKTKETSFKVNCEIYLPPVNPLNIKNSFGDTFVPDRSGLTNLSQSFGDLTVGRLRNAGEIVVEFGKLNAGWIDAKKIRSSYSDIVIKSLEGASKSNFEFCKILQINLSPNTDTLAINSSYSDLKINLSELMDADMLIRTNFGDVKNKSKVRLVKENDNNKPGFNMRKEYSGKTGNGKTYIKINSSYGDVNLN